MSTQSVGTVTSTQGPVPLDPYEYGPVHLFGTQNGVPGALNTQLSPSISPLAGKPATREMLIDLFRLEREYFERRPDSASGSFAARPSGTKDIRKIYAESFQGEARLNSIVREAREIVDRALESAA